MTIIDVWNYIKSSFQYLLKRWKLIVIVGLTGGVIGLTLSFVIKPTYTAKLSFSLIEGGGRGGLLDLANNLGFASLLNSGNDVFSGDNLLEIMKSKHAVGQTLLSTVTYKGQEMTLMEAYIDYNDLRKKWSKSKKQSLREVSFPVDQDAETLTRVQDSIISSVYSRYIKKNELKVNRLNKRVGMSQILFTSKDEEYSKLFVENLMDQTSTFYKETKTAQAVENLNMVQKTADSVRHLYETALEHSSSLSSVNVNRAMQTAMVPKLKQEYDVQLYGTVYAEVLKNLETLKLDLARETPIIQIIDKPRFPLKKDKLGKIKGVALGGIFAGFLIVLVLLVQYFFGMLQKGAQQENQ